MKNFLRIFFAFGLLCSNIARAEDAPRHFKVGVIICLTGTWAEYGTAIKNAVELARRDRPEIFSNVDFIYEDIQSVGKNTVTAFHKLRDQDQVDAVLVWGVEAALIAAPLGRHFKMPLLILASLSEDSPENPFAVRIANYAEQYSAKLAEFLHSRGYKKIGIVKSELSFYNDRANGLRKNLRPGETLDILYELQPTDIDLASVVSGLRTKHYDILGIYLHPQQISKFYRAAAEQNFSAVTFGESPFESRDLVAQSGPRIEGAYYTHNDSSPEFQKRYLKEFGNDAQLSWAAVAYDAATVIGEKFNAAREKLSPEEILSRMKNFPERTGVSGKFASAYKPGVGSYFNFPIVIKQIKGGEFKVIYR